MKNIFKKLWWRNSLDSNASAVQEPGNIDQVPSREDARDSETAEHNHAEVEYASSEDDSIYPTSRRESLDVGGLWEESDTEELGSTSATTQAQLSSSTIPQSPLMVCNETLSEQLITRNPWRTLQRYYPGQKRTTGTDHSCPILRLHAELLCMVAEYLPAESAATFTISCKHVYMKLGTQYLRFADRSTLWNFLLLIEPERQASFACCVCLKLHRPSINRRTGVSKCTKSWSKREDTKLPQSVTSGLVKMIGRKYLKNPRLCQEYLSWVAESRKKTTRYIKVAQHVTPRLLDGSLFIKTETYVHPFSDDRLTHRSLHEVFRLLEPDLDINTKLYDICAHRSWKKELLVPKQRRGCFDDSLADKCRWKRCNWHRRECYSNDVVSDKLKRKAIPRAMQQMLLDSQHLAEKSSAFGIVSSCDHCVTDYTITACEVNGVGRCMVFTTWKDLGGVRPGQADKWDTFFEARTLRVSFPNMIPKRSWVSVPETCLTYQDFKIPKGPRSKRAAYRYRPQPDWKMVRDLTRRPKRYRHRNQDGEYPTTASDADTDTGDVSDNFW